MSDLEQEMSMLQGLDLSGNTQPVQTQVDAPEAVQPVAPVQATQTSVQPVQSVQQAPTVLNLDVAQTSIDNNEFVTVQMGQKLSTAVIDKFKGQKDEKKRVAIFMPWFDTQDKATDVMAVKRHYSQELGSFVCWGGECCQYEDKATVRYLFPVIEFPIANNDASRPLPESYGECKLKLLVAGNELYSSLSDTFTAKGGTFEGYDLIMTCTEQQYQSFTVMPTNETVRGQYQSFNKCIEKWKAIREQAYTVVARKMDSEYYKNQKGIGYTGATLPNNVASLDSIIQQ